MQEAGKLSAEEQLRLAREKSLAEANESHALRPHGKIAGMDVFSWVNPGSGSLNAMLSSMAYKVIWAGTLTQVKHLLAEDAEGLKNVETLVIYDAGELPRPEWLKSFKNGVWVNSAEEALYVINKLRMYDRVFLWTLPRDNWSPIKETFDLRLKTWK